MKRASRVLRTPYAVRRTPYAVRRTRYAVTLLLAASMFGCAGRAREGPGEVGQSECVALLASDDLDVQSLRVAAERSLSYLQRAPARRNSPATRAVEVLAQVLRTQPESWVKSACRELQVVRVKTAAPILLTGYYAPVLHASRRRNSRFQYPLYELPRGRANYTRAEIDGGALDGKATVLAWLDDPIESFFLHVQGSGVLRLDDGTTLQVGYAGSNGRPYRSIGQWLIEQGKSWPEGFSAQGIKSYLRAHPRERDRILQVNQRYIYFRVRPDGPIGSIGVPLTAGRSVAADADSYAEGGVAFLKSDRGINRVVLMQDAGAAIKGPQRLDLFIGTGEKAGEIAGVMHEPATLHLFVAK